MLSIKLLLDLALNSTLSTAGTITNSSPTVNLLGSTSFTVHLIAEPAFSDKCISE